MVNLVVLRRALVEFGKRMRERGMIVAAEGNLSVRSGGHSFLVTPAGKPKGDLRVQDLLEIDLKGRTCQGRPTSEWPMHQLIYQMRPEINAVCHAHPAWATAMAVAGRPLDGTILTETKGILQEVPLAARAEPGTQEVPQGMADLIPEHNAILMGGHGVVTVGLDLAAAFHLLEIVERLAQVTILAGVASGLEIVPRQELIRLCQQESASVLRPK